MVARFQQPDELAGVRRTRAKRKKTEHEDQERRHEA